MNLFKSFIFTISMVNIIYGLPAQKNNKLRPWENKETKEKTEVSNSTKSAKDYVDIPEDLYNCLLYTSPSPRDS